MLKAVAQRGAHGAVATAIVVILTAAFVAVRMAGGGWNPVLERAQLWILDDLAFAAALGVPAVLGVLARRGRSGLYLAAGVLSTLLAVSPIVWTVVFAVPAVLFFVAYSPSIERAVRPAALVITCVLGLAPLAVLLLGPHDAVCWTHRTYVGGATTFARDEGAERASRDGRFSQTSGPPVAGETSSGGGCTDGAIPPRSSVPAVVLGATACLVGRRTIRS